MLNFYKIENNYPMTYSGDKPLDESWKEFTVTDGVYEPTVLNDAMIALDKEQANIEFKQYKKQLLDTITVTTSKGNTFDGNESSRNNMLSAIKASGIFNVVETNWKLADNTVASITLEELEEALALSISRAGTITLAQSMEELDE